MFGLEKDERRQLTGLLIAAAVIRLVTLPLNAAEYTDGVLQVTQFENPTGIWPPLYTGLVWPLHFVLGHLWAGRLVSAVASVLALVPLYLLARRMFGGRAALFAGLFYLTAPVANRWGIRVMTEATFSVFFFWACERICAAWDETDASSAERAFGGAIIAAVLAALTRYQGLLFTIPLFILFFHLSKKQKNDPLETRVVGPGIHSSAALEYDGRIYSRRAVFVAFSFESHAHMEGIGAEQRGILAAHALFLNLYSIRDGGVGILSETSDAPPFLSAFVCLCERGVAGRAVGVFEFSRTLLFALDGFLLGLRGCGLRSIGAIVERLERGVAATGLSLRALGDIRVAGVVVGTRADWTKTGVWGHGEGVGTGGGDRAGRNSPLY